MNKTLELRIKRTIAKKMNVKSNQVFLLESWSMNGNENSDFDFNETIAFNIKYNLYTNEGYKGDVLQYTKEDKMFVCHIEVAKQYRER